jgi:hypothetical protein
MNANEMAIQEANRIGSVEALDDFLSSLYRNPEITDATQRKVYNLYCARRAARNQG